MTTKELALVQGWDDTRAALARWRARPRVVLVPWTLGALAVAVALLAGTWVVAMLSTADPSVGFFPGLGRPATTRDLVYVLERNGLVLALHALACVAGFMAGSSLPQVAQGYTGFKRRVHDHAGPAAIAFVAAATLFSLATQAYLLGGQARDLSARLGLSPLELLLGLSLHALPELTALFLPLAAWTMASRAREWKDLLAATLVTVAIAIPVLVATAVVETAVTPKLLLALSSR
jgi:hypothetical protein